MAKANGTKYFQDKADVDKIRYLKEQQAFYDEVEKIHCDQDQVKEMQAQFEQDGNNDNDTLLNQSPKVGSKRQSSIAIIIPKDENKDKRKSQRVMEEIFDNEGTNSQAQGKQML